MSHVHCHMWIQLMYSNVSVRQLVNKDYNFHTLSANHILQFDVIFKSKICRKLDWQHSNIHTHLRQYLIPQELYILFKHSVVWITVWRFLITRSLSVSPLLYSTLTRTNCWWSVPIYFHMYNGCIYTTVNNSLPIDIALEKRCIKCIRAS